MAAANTDKFMEVGDPGTATTLSAPGYTAGATSINVGSTSNWPTATGVVFAMDEVTVTNGVETRVDGTYNEFVGTVSSGTQISDVDWVRGTGDRNYSPGSSTRVYIIVSAERENRLVQGILAQHKQDGSHGVVVADSITTTGNVSVSGNIAISGVVTGTNVIDSAQIKNGAATPAKLAPTKTTDANGWTCYDFGTIKQYRKQVTFSLTKNNQEGFTIVSTNFPVGMSGIGSNYIDSAISGGADMFGLTWWFNTATSTTSSLIISAENVSGATRVYTGAMDLTITVA